MSATANPVPQGLKRAARAGRFDGIRAKCLGDSILQLLQRAPEDLPARLKLRPEPKEAEAVVAGNVEPRNELVQQDVKLAARLAR